MRQEKRKKEKDGQTGRQTKRQTYMPRNGTHAAREKSHNTTKKQSKHLLTKERKEENTK